MGIFPKPPLCFVSSASERRCSSDWPRGVSREQPRLVLLGFCPEQTPNRRWRRRDVRRKLVLFPFRLRSRLSSASLRGSVLGPSRSSMAASRGLRSSKKRVDLFYDVVSSYSWLAFEVLCWYRTFWNIELQLRPSFLGGIMKETGNQPPAMLPKRGEYMIKDLQRMAKYYQVPVQHPKDFFRRVIEKGSLPAMRFVTAVNIAEPQLLESVSRELWMRIWSRDEDIFQPESILAAAQQAGLPLDQAKNLLEMSTSPELKSRLKATTDEALRYGAFGLPAVVAHVNGEPQMLFGSDRLELLAHVLGEKWLGPVPPSSKL